MELSRKTSVMSSVSGRGRITSVNELTPSASFSGAFAEEDLEILKEEARQEVESSSKRKLLKTVLMVAGVGCAAVAGFAAGYLTAPQSTVSTTPAAVFSPQYVLSDEQASSEEKLQSIVEQNYSLQNNEAVANPTKLAEALHAYRSDGTLLFNLPREFLYELDQIAPVEEGNRRLRAGESEDHFDTQTRLEKYDEMMQGDFSRDLQTSASTSAVIRQMWQYVKVSLIKNMAFTEAKGSDLAGVELSSDGKYCYILAQESDDSGDWSSNLSTGVVKIKNVSPIAGTTDRFGTTISAYKGFGNAYNAMRLNIWKGIQEQCSNGASNMKYVFGGFSRGGAITAIAAAALTKEGKLDARDISVINWGCPRTLKDKDSDSVQGIFFEQWRMTYKNDPIPSLPYGWMGGLRHFGYHKCRQCNYNPGRDAPGFAWPGGDHSKYNNWLPNLQSFDVRESHQKV